VVQYGEREAHPRFVDAAVARRAVYLPPQSLALPWHTSSTGAACDLDKRGYADLLRS
jgi:hypothetical protein